MSEENKATMPESIPTVTLGGGDEKARGATTVVSLIKQGVERSLESKGLPATLYLYVSSRPLDPEMISEFRLGEIQAKPIISQKDGRVMYNYGSKIMLGAHEVRTQGNMFLPKAGFTADKATWERYVSAKKEQAATRQANAKVIAGTDKK